jgi:hypothetical protein
VGRGDLPALAGLDIADPPELWGRLGFTVSGAGSCTLGGVTIGLRGPEAGEGLIRWALRAPGPLPASIDGIATTAATPDGPPVAATAHPNGAAGLDHVVVHTPDLRRTLSALEAVGMEVRRVREATPDLHQAFLWAGDVLIEVAGPPQASGDGPARLWGLVVVADDLERIAALPGQPLGSVRDAVQPGRRIATVRRELGSSIPLAFMTPHQPAGRTVESR